LLAVRGDLTKYLHHFSFKGFGNVAGEESIKRRLIFGKGKRFGTHTDSIYFLLLQCGLPLVHLRPVFIIFFSSGRDDVVVQVGCRGACQSLMHALRFLAAAATKKWKLSQNMLNAFQCSSISQRKKTDGLDALQIYSRPYASANLTRFSATFS
jgi:hypothetical protein